MPRLVTENIEEIELPSSTPDDRAVVVMDKTITTRQALLIADADDKSVAMLGLVADCIRSWNFVDAQGEVEPINADTVGRLSIEDFTLLANKVASAADSALSSKKVGTDEKKG